MSSPAPYACGLRQDRSASTSPVRLTQLTAKGG